jgi:hypothetical protein
MNLSTHNGILTVKSTRSGEHRTFQIKTQGEDARFAPGRRVVSLLIGPDNTSNYRSFGFVVTTPDGVRIQLWRKYSKAESFLQFDRLATLLERLDYHIAKGSVEINLEGRCIRCNRLLTTPNSVRKGIGPVCEGLVPSTILPNLA